MSEKESPRGPAPRANPHLYGHAAAEAALLEAYQGGRLAHAWILGGPRGIGKATLAYRFARFLLARPARGGGGGLFAAAPAPASLALASDHPVFRRVASGGHADLLTLERRFDEERRRLKTEIGIEEARTVADFLHLTPAEGGWRVVVIDGAEEMSRNAANAVLKIIEEPPAQALVLMVSHAPGRVLATLRSRCRRLTLKALDETALARVLAERLPELTGQEADLLKRLADGSAGRALALAEEGGLTLFREMMALLAGLPRLDTAALHRLADRTAGAQGESAYRTLTELLLWWLARLVRAAGTRQIPTELVAGEGALCGRLAAEPRLDRWLEVWEKIGHLLARQDSVNLERKQVVLNAFLALESAAQ